MSADLKLPDTFDVVVCGTGLTESMVAASLSRIGKKVLHIDRHDYYGSHWATFTFESLGKWIKSYQNPEVDNSEPILNGDAVPQKDVCVKNICVRCYISEKPTPILQSETNDLHTSADSYGDKGMNVVAADSYGDKGMNVVEPSDRKVETNDDCKVEQSEIFNTGHETESNQQTQQVICNAEDTIETNVDPVSTSEGIKEVINNVNSDLAISISIDSGKSLAGKPPLSMISQARIKQNSHDISLEDFVILSRKFNLDITTKFLFSAGPLVKTIIKANISHYAEFKVVNRILTWKDDQITEVPCNRADVFGSTFLTMIEKRMLMKFLTFCLESPSDESEDTSSFSGKPFTEFLDSRKLSDNLKKFIIYSIALVKPDTHTEVALTATHKFLKSLGRYGKSPFIWPLYGIGELPQAFCRMSAVFGGTYCLNVTVDTIATVENNNNFQIGINGQKILTDCIVTESSYVPYRFEAKSSGKMISRGILITNQSLLPTAEEHLSFLTIPPLLGHEEAVRVIEVGPASSACPSGLFVLYLTCASSFNTAEEDLLQYTTLLAARSGEGEDANKPKLLWSVYYNQLDDVVFDDIPENFFIPSLPDSSLCFDKAVEEAKKIFDEICPGEEFMLAVPNSEDIIWGDGNDTTKEEDVPVEDDGSKEKMDVENRIEENVCSEDAINKSDENNMADNIEGPTNSDQCINTDEVACNTNTHMPSSHDGEVINRIDKDNKISENIK